MFDSYGVFLCGSLTVTKHGQAFLVTCATTGLETIWSPSELGTYRAACAEHREAHEAREAALERARARAHAIRIYNTTEVGHPARRGIGAYL